MVHASSIPCGLWYMVHVFQVVFGAWLIFLYGIWDTIYPLHVVHGTWYMVSLSGIPVYGLSDTSYGLQTALMCFMAHVYTSHAVDCLR